MARWRKTKTPGVYVAHQTRCPAFGDEDARCRCEPSWRGRCYSRATGRSEWQKPVTKDRNEVGSWLGIGKRGATHAREQAKANRTFESIGDEWLDGVLAGRISRRKGRSKPYSATTTADYARAYRSFLRPELGPIAADDVDEIAWQMWCDRLSREGLSRSRISTLVAVASAIYAWAMTPTRRYATRNPPYAIAFYAGLRRSDIHRLEWPDVLEGRRIANRLLVTRSKSEAGTERRPRSQPHLAMCSRAHGFGKGARPRAG